jgi:hypothetical protein
MMIDYLIFLVVLKRFQTMLNVNVIEEKAFGINYESNSNLICLDSKINNYYDTRNLESNSIDGGCGL